MTANPEITETEWEALAKNWPPVVEREDGSGLLLITGKWAEEKTVDDYVVVEIASRPIGEVGPRVAQKMASARGGDVEEFRDDAIATWDGMSWRSAAGPGYVTVWWVAPQVPVRLKCGQRNIKSGWDVSGTSKVHFYGGSTSAPGYRSQSQAFQRDHADLLNAPQPPSPKQVEILQKFADRANAWGLGSYAIPTTSVGAKEILDSLGANQWKLRGDEVDPLSVWRQVLREEQPEPPVPSGQAIRAPRPELEDEL